MRIVVYGPDGTIIEDRGESEVPAPEPMLSYEVVAVLNVVLGLWSLADAANAIGRQPEDLIAEAEAWAAAEGSQP
jgi:hypothetical protein